MTIHKTISATVELDEDDINTLERILSYFVEECILMPGGTEIISGGRDFARTLLRELGDD